MVDKYYTYRLFPTTEQQDQLVKFIGCSRYVYNKGVEKKIKGCIHGKVPGYIELSSQLTKERKENEWLQKCPSQVLQMALRQLDNDSKYQLPKFCKKNKGHNIRFPQGVRVVFKHSTIKLPGIGNVKCIYDRRFIGSIKMITVYKTCTQKWFAKITTKSATGVSIKKHCEEGTIGISRGINTLYAISNGQRISNPLHIQNTKKRLLQEKRSLLRKKQGSSNYKKQKFNILKIQERLNNQERDYIQKISTKMIREYSSIVIEDVDCLLYKVLKYKCNWYGNNLIQIPKCSTCVNTCSSCGNVQKSEGVNWKCAECSSVHNRNMNNAMNVKIIGLRNQPPIVNKP